MKHINRKDKGLIGHFSLAMGLLSISLIVLWLLFYFLTVGITQENMKRQVDVCSQAVISSVEDELLFAENVAYYLKHNENIEQMTAIEDRLMFYNLGGLLCADDTPVAQVLKNSDNAIVFNKDGLFYRLKGTVPNTLLNRAYYLMKTGSGRIITLMSNGSAYIGSYDEVIWNNEVTGYVLLLIEQDRIERLLNAYNDLDYLNTALYSGERLLCSNRHLSAEEIEKNLKEAVLEKEADIGLSGFRMLVFCDNTLSKSVSDYFRIAMPVTVAILALVILFYVGYLRKHMIAPINSVIANTTKEGNAPLPRTGEEYFDGLVDHVNEMLVRIEDREKALYVSEVRLKEAELEKERTLISLLKKQINAHFTVNTLNVVRALIYKDEKEQAARICDELSTLLRYANAGDEYISLLEEFYVLEQYLGIMRTRYPDMIETDIDEDDSYADIYIPRMLLQPIVENAIVHGLAGGKGRVTAAAKTSGDEVIISIEDNGKGMTRDELAELIDEINSDDSGISDTQVIGHIALKNIQKRIKMVCGEKYGLIIDSKEGSGTRVDVHLPVKVTTR